MFLKSLISRQEVVDLEPRTLLVFWPQTQRLFTESYRANLSDMASGIATVV